jgi:hypothetical protein
MNTLVLQGKIAEHEKEGWILGLALKYKSFLEEKHSFLNISKVLIKKTNSFHAFFCYFLFF